MSKTRTRFAPSPTGSMHIGNLRTAVYAYALAKHSGGDFILRIEDTDKKREVTNGVSEIIIALTKFGIKIEEGVQDEKTDLGSYGPYKQSERKNIYLAFIKFKHKTKAPKVLRLDGVYYNKKSKNHRARNKDIRFNLLKADGVIYQSVFFAPAMLKEA